jgi:hypothetical protein
MHNDKYLFQLFQFMIIFVRFNKKPSITESGESNYMHYRRHFPDFMSNFENVLIEPECILKIKLINKKQLL